MTTQELEKIIEMYNEGNSLNELSRCFNYHPTTIKNNLIKANVKIITRAEQNAISNMKRTKKINHEYFSNINNVNKAWMLGFLAADGTIRKDRNEIKIGLSSIDREILEKIKEEMDMERNIHDSITGNGFNVSELCWSSKQQKEDLKKYGIVNNKTYLPMHLPNFEDKKLKLAFILGYFDGDGTISISKEYYLRFRICSYRDEILKDFAQFLKKEYNIDYSLSQKERGLYELSISTKYAKIIFNELYSLNSLKLDRKYQKYLEYINHETTASLKEG